MPAVVKLGCDYFHAFHADCVTQHYNSAKNEFYKCPICLKIFGERTGDMPKGVMSWHFNYNQWLQGNNQPGAIEITYQMPNGQHNGVNYRGTKRVAYLPNCQQGQETLALLVEAFKRKLTFLVGTSQTTGERNVVCWAGIHHKTSTSGGTNNFGWPDPTYF